MAKCTHCNGTGKIAKRKWAKTTIGYDIYGNKKQVEKLVLDGSTMLCIACTKVQPPKVKPLRVSEK